ncbi:hypothetical protein H8356DRAFT_1352846 [Neocallimastix lanati (nom. inval.)]|nr:hypothetical protein H8356DRAFT_1352846 [Neocallimastix sp. JGI-2020a]
MTNSSMNQYTEIIENIRNGFIDIINHIEPYNENSKKYAIVFIDEKISYRKLNEMNNALRRYLRKQGVGRNDIISVISERFYMYVVAVLGISKAGGKR